MKKQLINIAIVGLVFAILTANPIFAQENADTQIAAPQSTLTEKSDQNLESEQKTISPKLEKELKTEISKVYGSEQTNEIYNRIIEIAQKAKNERPQNLKHDDLTRPNDWYKDEIIYMFYCNIDNFIIIKQIVFYAMCIIFSDFFVNIFSYIYSFQIMKELYILYKLFICK